MLMQTVLTIIFHVWLVICADNDFLLKDYHKAPKGWRSIGRAPAHHVLHLKIGLTQRDFPELKRQLHEAADPRHANYGKYLSKQQVHDLVTPETKTLQAVEEWLNEAGIHSHRWYHNHAKTWINLPVTVSEAEVLMDTEYFIWQHEDGSELVRTQAWSLPENLHCHITTIQPTNNWARANPRIPIKELRAVDNVDSIDTPANLPDIPPPPDSAIAALCNFSSVDIACLRTLYGTASYTVRSGGKSKLGICDYIGEYNNRTDTYDYLSIYRPEAAQAALNFTQISINGGPIFNGTKTAINGDMSGIEGDLDVQMALGVGYPLEVITWSTGGLQPGYMPDAFSAIDESEPYLRWTDYILAQDDIPQVISQSYGDDEQTVSLPYAEAVCNEFAQIAARGVTILFGSGDFGVGFDGECYSNKDNTTRMFIPEFPCDCPYVTNVGGTRNYPEVAGYLPLPGLPPFTSGAGFSNYFDMPEWQNETVNNYIAGLDGLYDGLYNKSGRAYPDIAAMGQYFPIIWNGSERYVQGTSASAPITAAILGFVNDALIAAGRPPLGFMNPWLYSEGWKAFTDVTEGHSYGCNTTGFPATVGWDAVTGWGTPYLPSLLKILNL